MINNYYMNKVMKTGAVQFAHFRRNGERFEDRRDRALRLVNSLQAAQSGDFIILNK